MDHVKIFKALSDMTRIEIVRFLSAKNEISCQELQKHFALSQPTMSHHFNKLVDARILSQRKKGVLWFYRINKTHLKKAGINVKKLLSEKEGGV